MKTDALDIKILTAAAEVEEVAAEWQELHRLYATGTFGGYEDFLIWYANLGQGTNFSLHIVVARGPDGALKAVLPLLTQRRGLIKILGWAGVEVFDDSDILADSPETAAAVWNHLTSSKAYDIAIIKDIRETARSYPALSQRMRARLRNKSFYLTLDFPSGEAWLQAQSRKLRGDVRRKSEKMQAKGAVAFRLYQNGDTIPDAVIDSLCTNKAAWSADLGLGGVVEKPELKNFLHDYIRFAARRETLYLAWLTCGETIVAVHLGFVRDDVLCLYMSCFDAAYGSYSPGNIMMVETIKAAIDKGWREIDYLRGDEAYKQRFASGSRLAVDFIVGCTWKGKASVYWDLWRKTKSQSAEARQTEEATE